MDTIRHHQILSLAFISAVIMLTGCSSYTFHHLSINGRKEVQFSVEGCPLSLTANQNETLETVNLPFQLTKGITVQLDALKLSVDGEQISPKSIIARHRGKERQGTFEVTQAGTLTLTLDKSIVNSRTLLQLLPSAFISCNKQNLINQVIEIRLKDLK